MPKISESSIFSLKCTNSQKTCGNQKMGYSALNLFFHKKVNIRTAKKLKNSVQEEELESVQ